LHSLPGVLFTVRGLSVLLWARRPSLYARVVYFFCPWPFLSQASPLFFILSVKRLPRVSLFSHPGMSLLALSLPFFTPPTPTCVFSLPLLPLVLTNCLAPSAKDCSSFRFSFFFFTAGSVLALPGRLSPTGSGSLPEEVVSFDFILELPTFLHRFSLVFLPPGQFLSSAFFSFAIRALLWKRNFFSFVAVAYPAPSQPKVKSLLFAHWKLFSPSVFFECRLSKAGRLPRSRSLNMDSLSRRVYLPHFSTFFLFYPVLPQEPETSVDVEGLEWASPWRR